MVVVRLLFGLGAVSAQNDGYAWGIWKPLNVVTFTGIAAGAYAVGLVTYLFNDGEYHPLVRSAVMTGAVGYTLAGTSVLIDLGRWWNLWVVFWPGAWNLNSVLLEVALCVMAYTMVLWVEVGPAVLEKLSAGPDGRVAARGAPAPAAAAARHAVRPRDGDRAPLHAPVLARRRCSCSRRRRRTRSGTPPGSPASSSSRA